MNICLAKYYLPLLRTVRPKQWIKNVLIIAPMFFAKQALNQYILVDKLDFVSIVHV